MRNIGYLPNYGLGRGKNYGNYDDEWVTRYRKKKGKKILTQTKVKMMKVEDHQILYNAAMESFRDFCDKYGGTRMMWKGELVLVRPFLLMLTGDTKEFNEATCHFNSCGNKGVKRLMKCCLCTPLKMGSVFPPRCKRTTLAHIERALEDAEYAKAISQHQHQSIFNDLPIADTREGINGMTPYEDLHVNGQGNLKDSISNINNVIGEGDTNKSKKEEVDLLFGAIANQISRNSERRIPLYSNNFGIMDCSKTTARENTGNNLVLGASMFSDRGREIMKTPCASKKLSISDMISTISLLLSYNAWCNSMDIRKWELDNAGPAVSFLMESMVKNLPNDMREGDKKTKGSNGYCKIKFHALWVTFLDQGSPIPKPRDA